MDFVAAQRFDSLKIRALTIAVRRADECLNAHWFLSLEGAQQKVEAWRNEYNSFRPHSSL
jgi:transposase InsO family protein